jgi:hypothetical protein
MPRKKINKRDTVVVAIRIPKEANDWLERGREEYAEYLLLYLNPMQPDYKNPEHYKNLMGNVSGIPYPMPGTRPAPKGVRDAAFETFQRTLRELTDQWIDSGRLQLKEIGEQPMERSILAPVPDYPVPLETILRSFFSQHPLRVLPDKDRLVGYFGILRAGTWEQLEKKSRDELLQRARDYATEQFVLLLDSPSRHRLFRCDICGTYFVRERMPKRDMAITRGTFCDGCKQAGNILRMEGSRSNKAGRRLKLAADALIKWKPGNRCGEKKEWIRQRVNEGLEKENLDPIQINWVTRHLAEIEAEVEGRGHATRKN